MLLVCFCAGGPGVGKGTQCQLLASEYGDAVAHLSAGELLRAEQTLTFPPTAWGRVITESLGRGEIVPVEITLSLLRKAMIATKKKVVLIDGFPRNWDNILGWNKMVPLSEASVEAVVCIDGDSDLMFKRIMGRAASSGRDDDNAESFSKRYDRFQSDTQQIIKHFDEQQKCVHVDGSQEVEEVYRDFRKVCEHLVKK
jgi:UMP-CMP kinase